ncbi:pilus assembly protein PilY [Stigmatella sp. ncwal1]|uniref:Pilus assembly protein PilY n=1 Tax=Stigmatella ashevillensis TaxID=2995309 RepID=A0ABT5DEV0_9BACT|nr:pilus assembly protein PilY [Stigmatella ashevillena]MDC0711643.1 pilus assembly protein PilY [Stigmatella ashevillena]
MKRWVLGWMLLGAVGAASAQLGSSGNSPACCQLTTSLIEDVLLNVEPPGDERFFRRWATPPNVHFILDVSPSMADLPQVDANNYQAFYDATVNGCENPKLNAFADTRGWQPGVQYPLPDNGTGIGPDTGFPDLFRDNRYYAMGFWGTQNSPPPQWNTREQACQSVVPQWNTVNAAQYVKCLQCLSTRGYFKAFNSGISGQTNPDFILWGRFLNFNPPKYVTARAVLKRVIKDLRGARVGLSVLNGTSSSHRMRLRPGCQAGLLDPSAFDDSRWELIYHINALSFQSGNSLARALLNTGYYFTSGPSVYRDVFGFGSNPANYSYPGDFANEALSSELRSICWGHQATEVILIADGEPVSDSLSSLMMNRIRTRNGGPVNCPASRPCPDQGANAGNYLLDDVAKLLATSDLQHNTPPVVGDLDTRGQQSIRVHAIGYGFDSNLLKNTVDVGGGLYYSVDDADSLKNALLHFLAPQEIPARTTALAAPALALPRGGGLAAAAVPRLRTFDAQDTQPRQGFLYRFRHMSERELGCEPAAPFPQPGDLNADGDCDDLHLMDAEDQAVVETAEGTFVKRSNATVPAKPYWEAGQVLKPEGVPTARWKERRIFTLVDGNGDGKIDHQDTPVEFTEANAGVLMESLGIHPTTFAPECQRLYGFLPANTPLECARLVIRWYRGADAMNPETSQRGLDRPFLLHGSAHASPIAVEPPASKARCDTSPQCTRALYSGATPLQEGYLIPGNARADAYDKYRFEAGTRDQLLLMGSSGGMLHAFHNGRFLSAEPETELGIYDAGTGQELWAVVPPDMLPKMLPNVGKHAYFVDGTAMVREVWMDGVGAGAVRDGRKQWMEYRTVAVVGSGRGGVHHFALDLTDLLATDLPSTPRLPNTPGTFLWMWPQPCDALALQVGQSVSHFSPQAPPLGAVALTPPADDALGALRGMPGVRAGKSLAFDEVSTRERWVVALNGGYDPHQMRGRGMALVDLATGHTVWSFFLGDGQRRSDQLLYPVTAGVALADVDNLYKGTLERDELFDTATVGDYGGQLWVARFWNPGHWNATTQRVDNWHAARAFRVASQGGSPERLRGPFASTASNWVRQETGELRTFVGTGDRQNLSEESSVCHSGNMRACAEQGCSVSNALEVYRGGQLAASSEARYGAWAYAQGGHTPGTPGPACQSAQVRFTSGHGFDAACGGGSSPFTMEYRCTGSSNAWRCEPWNAFKPSFRYVRGVPPYPERFYGLSSYGGAPSRTFNTSQEADAFERQMLTDADLQDVGQFDASGAVTPDEVEASPSGKGWYLTYARAFERTSTSAAVVNGCVLWNALEAHGVSAQGGWAAAMHTARLYQADPFTGKAHCAAGFSGPGGARARFLGFASTASPPEVIPLRWEAEGQVHTSVVLSTPVVPRADTGQQQPLVSVPVSP